MAERPVRRVLPPVLFLLGLVAQIAVLALAWPLDPAPWELALGAALAVVGLWFAFAGRGAFTRAKTNVVPFTDPSTVVVTGPFRFTRNPMYLGIVLVLTGTAVAGGEPVNLIAPALLLAWLHFRYVLHEERFMAERFGETYEAYKNSVPRWIWPL